MIQIQKHSLKINLKLAQVAYFEHYKNKHWAKYIETNK